LKRENERIVKENNRVTYADDKSKGGIRAALEPNEGIIETIIE